MLEGLQFECTTRAGGVGGLVEPGRVGREVAFSRAHLVNPPCVKFPQAHKGMGGQVRGVTVVGEGR